MDDPRISIADKLFAAWSSGDLDAPAQYLTADAVLFDVVGGEHQGWPAIRAYFAKGLESGLISLWSPTNTGSTTPASP